MVRNGTCHGYQTRRRRELTFRKKKCILTPRDQEKNTTPGTKLTVFCQFCKNRQNIPFNPSIFNTRKISQVSSTHFLFYWFYYSANQCLLVVRITYVENQGISTRGVATRLLWHSSGRPKNILIRRAATSLAAKYF